MGLDRATGLSLRTDKRSSKNHGVGWNRMHDSHTGSDVVAKIIGTDRGDAEIG